MPNQRTTPTRSRTFTCRYCGEAWDLPSAGEAPCPGCNRVYTRDAQNRPRLARNSVDAILKIKEAEPVEIPLTPYESLLGFSTIVAGLLFASTLLLAMSESKPVSAGIWAMIVGNIVLPPVSGILVLRRNRWGRDLAGGFALLAGLISASNLIAALRGVASPMTLPIIVIGGAYAVVAGWGYAKSPKRS